MFEQLKGDNIIAKPAFNLQIAGAQGKSMVYAVFQKGGEAEAGKEDKISGYKVDVNSSVAGTLMSVHVTVDSE